MDIVRPYELRLDLLVGGKEIPLVESPKTDVEKDMELSVMHLMKPSVSFQAKEKSEQLASAGRV